MRGKTKVAVSLIPMALFVGLLAYLVATTTGTGLDVDCSDRSTQHACSPSETG